MEKEYKMSAARAQELQEELNYLKTTRSDEVAEQIKIARGFGDLSENAEYDEAKTVDATREMAGQVNGKLKTTITVPSDSDDSVIVEAACADEKVKRLMEDKKLVKTIVVKNKLINLIIK